jgi:Arc/MetJ-type ribon-helix-helix transcriptional regulator
MVKNEIHARLSPEVMEQIRQWTDNWKFLTISHTVRRLLELGLKVANDELDLQKKNDSLIQLIEQELKVSFDQCRKKSNYIDGQLYWFWFEAKEESSWRFDPNSLNNQCPAKRFESREDAIRDCLKEKLANPVNVNALTESLLPSLKSTDESNEENIIDW